MLQASSSVFCLSCLFALYALAIGWKREFRNVKERLSKSRRQSEFNHILQTLKQKPFHGD